jgi:glc operon protein GlcG
MFKGIASITLVVALAPSPACALAQAPPTYGAEITLETARKIAAAAIAEAVKNKWPVAVAIVDNHGFLVYFERLDDTQTAGSAFAVEKARTASMFRRPTRTLEDTSKTRVAVLSFPGATPVTGGLPIVVDGKIIDGIGVSGVTADQDEQIARAGLDGLK